MNRLSRETSRHLPHLRGTRRLPRPTWLVLGLTVAALAACSGSSDSEDTVTVQGDVPLAYVKRLNTLAMNPTDGTNSAPGGDLMVRAKSSPSATEVNLTQGFTLGRGDVSDPEVSYDGKKIVFSMRCPANNNVVHNGQQACTGRWNIWEYDMSAGGLTGGTFRRVTSSTQFDDVDPAYLPGGQGFVFASNRQEKTRVVSGGQTILALDEYEREAVLNLHTMKSDGSQITQISVNQSHDRNPVVRPDGRIMFSRWEHVGPRNRFAIFLTKPDGTDMFVLYGAQSPGNSFLHPRDMDPAGKYAGKVASSLMSLSGTQEGGALMMIDAKNYSEANTPANSSVPARGGQEQTTALDINDGRGFSPNGRFTTPYPLWDGTDRMLVSYRTCQVTRRVAGQPDRIVPCASLTDGEKRNLSGEARMRGAATSDGLLDNVPASYAIYMYNPADQTQLLVAVPPAGFMYTDPIALQPRTEPNVLPPTEVNIPLRDAGMAEIEVRSVYDTDGLNRMGEQMIVPVDRPGCDAGIAKRDPIGAEDTRAKVADLEKIKDPADPAYHCTPVRFIRATRAVAPQQGMTGMREAIGETDFEPQQILGYAPIEPDGSFKLRVPADVPLALTVVDTKGRGLQTHLNWIQVRPGERRTCDGCHSPRRGASLNSGTTVNAKPAAWNAALSAAHAAGETMASLRTRLNDALKDLTPDMEFTDVWADTAKPNVTARAPIKIKYTGNDNVADDLVTPAPVRGLINYPDHIQPIWSRNRGAATCTNAGCHDAAANLNLQGTVAGTGRLASYEELLVGDPIINTATGLPVIVIREGVPEVERGPALVDNMAGSAEPIARSSRLTEILYGEELKASSGARTAHPTPAGAGVPDHTAMLNLAERRLVVEWMDLGGQYYNDLTAPGGGVRRVVALSEESFTQTVQPILLRACAACHQPGGNSGSAQAGPVTTRSRFVITGSSEGDYNVTLSMISDVCTPANNYLLSRPSTVPHPSGALNQTAAVLPPTSADYTTIANWIASGCNP